MEVKKCKFCGAPIVWLKTLNGRPMPCNAEAVKYQENYKGKDVIVLSDGKVIKATVVNPNGGGLAPIVDGEGYISHFATCTHANEARQPRRTDSPAPHLYGKTAQTYTVDEIAPEQKPARPIPTPTRAIITPIYTLWRKRQARSVANGNGRRRIHRKRLV